MNKEKVKAFLLELECLTRKHGITIGGCGCCGSPFLLDEDTTHPQAGYAIDGETEYLEWIDPRNVFAWEREKYLTKNME